jgi:hypothetical protein
VFTVTLLLQFLQLLFLLPLDERTGLMPLTVTLLLLQFCIIVNILFVVVVSILLL